MAHFHKMMKIYASPIILLIFAFAFWLAWQIQKELRVRAAVARTTVIPKKQHPVQFWIVLVGQFVIVVVLLLLGSGLLIDLVRSLP